MRKEREVDECVGCSSLGLPCYGSSCPNRHAIHVYHECDFCGKDDDSYDKSCDVTIYELDGDHVCGECLQKMEEAGEDVSEAVEVMY